MDTPSVSKKETLFELPTFQRRLRHLRSITIRNLKCSHTKGEDITKLQSFYTLHTDKNKKAFYCSEKITGSLNPTWQSFDISRYEEDIDTRLQHVHLRVWVGCADKYRLLFDWQINLTGLLFFSDKLDSGMKYSANTVIIGMFDKFFRAPDIQQQPATKSGVYINHIIQVETSAVRNSYTSGSLSRIHTVLRAAKQTQASVTRLHHSIDDTLLLSEEKTRKLALREDLLLKRGQLRNEVAWQTSQLQVTKENYDKRKTVNQASRSDLEGKRSKLEREKFNLREKRKAYNQTRESLIKENAQLAIRRKQLLSELVTYIYPIVERKKHEFFICQVRLPNSEDFQGHDETMVATALGYTCHLVQMLSHILDIPLRYSMEHRVSKSIIRDHIHTKLTTEKDREFPLYSKGKERFQFNYGVFLLNKNISQMRFYLGLGTTDLRTTLQNITTLMELRLGMKSDVPHITRAYISGSEGKEKLLSDFDKTDTQSSLASAGRVSLPDSNEPSIMDGEEPLTRNSHNATETNNYKSSETNAFPASEMFHPSEDNFFKVTNPVSETFYLFNSMNGDSAIREDSSIPKISDNLPTGSDFGNNRDPPSDGSMLNEFENSSQFDQINGDTAIGNNPKLHANSSNTTSVGNIETLQENSSDNTAGRMMNGEAVNTDIAHNLS